MPHFAPLLFIPDQFLDGIYWGFFLAILAGPLLVALLQTGIERGFKAGFMVGFGIWISDLLFILAVYYGVSYVVQVVNIEEEFKFYFGCIGGSILMIFGISTMFSKPPNLNQEVSAGKKFLTWSGLFIKGFLINTLNPFTFFFWISVTSSVVVKNGYDANHAFWFFSGILSTIVLTDSLKIYSAKAIKNKMKPSFLQNLRVISGVAFVLFGMGLIIRVWLYP